MMDEVKPEVLIAFMLDMEARGYKPGGIMSVYRSIRALCRFWADETDDEFRDPTRKVRPPKVVIKPIPGVSVEDIEKIINNITGRMELRDTALLLTLLDSGARRTECANLNVGDLDLETGKISVLSGKGDKDRSVFVGRKKRRAIKRYLKTRKNLRTSDPLWLNEFGDRLKSTGIRQVVRRRALASGFKDPGTHDFRRAFALQIYRNGVDSITLSRQMGHSALEVLKRYLNQNDDDLREAHERFSPVDNADF